MPTFSHPHLPPRWTLAAALTLLMACDREVDVTRAPEAARDAGAPLPAPSASPEPPRDPWAEITHAVARLDPTEGNAARGIVRFAQTDRGVHVEVELSGLEPGSKHAFHVHEFGDCSAKDAASAGGHYRGGHESHGLPPSESRHAGDMGNLVADDDGAVRFRGDFDLMHVAAPTAPIIGRAVIVHEKVDDGSQPVGNAGGRIACGVIGVAKAPGPS
jgi:Cu-Zn family superoxide dismutase